MFETLINEPQNIYVIFFFKGGQDADKAKKISDLRAQVKQKLLGTDVSYTEVDTNGPKKDTYQQVYDLLELKTELVDQSPIVATCYNRGGHWIHGDGVPKEAAETIQAFVRAQMKLAKQSKAEAVSFGGSSRHSTDRKVSVGGY